MADMHILRILRTAKGMTLKELAKSAGCNDTYLSLIERGLVSPRVSTIEKIAKALDVNVIDLMRLLEGDATVCIATNSYRLSLQNSPEA